MKIPNFDQLLQNKLVLYIVLFISLANIVAYLAYGNVDSVVFFALIGLLVSYFSKNMIIILLTAVVTTTFYTNGRRRVEGLENKGDDGEDGEEDEKKKGEDHGEKGEEKKDKAVDGSAKPKEQPKKDANKKQAMQNLNPAKYNETEDDEDVNAVHGGIGAGKNKNRVDYAETLEQAYDNLQNIIGEDGVRGLTDQTKSLMEQQKNLMDNMKNMEPLLKTAQGFMNQLTGNGGLATISNMLGGLGKPGDAAAAAK